VDALTRDRLLAIARASIERCTGRRAHPRPSEVGFGEHGAFVSLHTRGGALRGCVGCLSATEPLGEVVEAMAEAAALRDPRFQPVRADEVDELSIEISVLAPSEPLASLAELELGREGLVVVGRGQRGVLLPQVATEHGWDAATFAEQTCVKARLPPDAYLRDDVQLYRFRAEVFSEPAPPPHP